MYYQVIRVSLISLLLETVFGEDRSDTYSITINVYTEESITDTAYHVHTDGCTLSLCTNLCTVDSDCTSFMLDDAEHKCYFYREHVNVKISEEVTSVTYSEKRVCLSKVETFEKCCHRESKLNDCMINAPTKVFKDCQDAFEQGERKTGSIYSLRPNPTWNIIRAVCQFDSTSGWTVIQRRVDDSVDFYRKWTSYVEGFGYLENNYWIGLDAIYYLTRENRNLSIYLEDHDGEIRTANYSTFYIDDGSTEYVNHISGYSGDAGDSWMTSNLLYNLTGQRFSTYDNDNDDGTANCAVTNKAGWWFNRCTYSNLNGIWYPEGQSNLNSARWSTWKARDSLKTIYIRVGHAEFNAEVKNDFG